VWTGENYIIRSLMMCNTHSIIVHVINREEWDRRGMWVVCGRGEERRTQGFSWGNLKERDHLGNQA